MRKSTGDPETELYERTGIIDDAQYHLSNDMGKEAVLEDME